MPTTDMQQHMELEGAAHRKSLNYRMLASLDGSLQAKQDTSSAVTTALLQHEDSERILQAERFTFRALVLPEGSFQAK